MALPRGGPAGFGVVPFPGMGHSGVSAGRAGARSWHVADAARGSPRSVSLGPCGKRCRHIPGLGAGRGALAVPRTGAHRSPAGPRAGGGCVPWAAGGASCLPAAPQLNNIPLVRSQDASLARAAFSQPLPALIRFRPTNWEHNGCNIPGSSAPSPSRAPGGNKGSLGEPVFPCTRGGEGSGAFAVVAEPFLGGDGAGASPSVSGSAGKGTPLEHRMGRGGQGWQKGTGSPQSSLASASRARPGHGERRTRRASKEMVVPPAKPAVLSFPSSPCSSPFLPAALALLSPTVPGPGLTVGGCHSSKL